MKPYVQLFTYLFKIEGGSIVLIVIIFFPILVICFFNFCVCLFQLLQARNKVNLDGEDQILWKDSNVWAMSDIESDEEGNKVFATAEWRREEYSELN